MVSSHEMSEFAWDVSLRDMPLAISCPRATAADCVLKCMGLSDEQLSNIHVFSGNVAPSETPAEFSRSLCVWMDAFVRARGCSDSQQRSPAWPNSLPKLISEWHAQFRHVQWISTGPLGNVAIALRSSQAAERPDAVISACHQASASDAHVIEANVKLDPSAFTTSLALAQTLNTPLLLVLLNTSGYFCQWLAASSAECPAMDLRCFRSSM